MTVEELLVVEKIKFKQSPADFVVHCLNPEHDDTNPSMRIDKITGVFNCFSCGFKGNIFKHFDKPSNYLDIKREKPIHIGLLSAMPQELGKILENLNDIKINVKKIYEFRR